MLEWEDVAYSLFNEDDGQLHDIFVFDVSLADWDALFDLVRTSNWWHHYVEDGKEIALPDSAAEVFARRDAHGVALALKPFGGMSFTTHLFEPDEIDFDIDVRDFTGQQHLDQLVRFLRTLGLALERNVHLTPEG